MNILMVWDGDYPWDVRVEKVCNALIESGNEVYLVCRNSQGKNRRELVDNIKVRRIYSLASTQKFLNAVLTFPAFFSPIWLLEIDRAIKDIKPELIVVRDLPMALGALILAKKWGVPIALDMAECYPEMLRCIWKYEDFKPQNILIRNPLFADIVERLTIKNVDLIWVMVEESAKRLLSMGVKANKVHIVSNTPLSNAITEVTKSKQVRTSLKITYIGLLNPSRGLRTLLEAARILKERKRDFNLMIVGDGKDAIRLQIMASKMELLDRVFFAGWVNHKSIGQILADSDVGIVPHYKCSHWDNTIPNKLFDYMKAGIPVIVSDARPTKRIVFETECGLVYRNQDPEDLANTIEKLFDPLTRFRLGNNGQKSVIDRYCWERDRAVLLSSIAKVTSASLV